MNQAIDIEMLVQQFEARLFGFAVRLTGSESDACDLYQQTWIKVMRTTSRPNPGEEFGWLCRTMKTCWIDHHRKAARRNEILAGEATADRWGASAEVNPLQHSLQKERSDALRECLHRLSETWRNERTGPV